MSYTKLQLINEAFDVVGLSSFVFDLTPSDLQSAARKLDSMMSSWDSLGIHIGYPVSTNPQNISTSDESNAPSLAVQAIVYNLGIRIAPSFGKQLSQDVKQVARESYLELLRRYSQVKEMQLPIMPIGAGSKNIDYPFTQQPVNSVDVDGSAELDLI